MGVSFVHFNPEIFVDPLTFNPDRWLEDRSGRESLDTWLVPFSRGTRMCLGIKYVSLSFLPLLLSHFSIRIALRGQSST